MSEELKSCPFCGREAESIHIDAGLSFVRCENMSCGALVELPNPIYFSKLAWNTRAYEAEIDELNKQVDKWMGDYQRIYNDWGGQNEFLKRENDDLKAQLSVALEAMLYAEKHLTGTALDKVQSAIQQIEVNKSPG